MHCWNRSQFAFTRRWTRARGALGYQRAMRSENIFVGVRIDASVGSAALSSPRPRESDVARQIRGSRPTRISTSVVKSLMTSTPSGSSAGRAPTKAASGFRRRVTFCHPKGQFQETLKVIYYLPVLAVDCTLVGCWNENTKGDGNEKRG